MILLGPNLVGTGSFRCSSGGADQFDIGAFAVLFSVLPVTHGAGAGDGQRVAL